MFGCRRGSRGAAVVEDEKLSEKDKQLQEKEAEVAIPASIYVRTCCDLCFNPTICSQLYKNQKNTETII